MRSYDALMGRHGLHAAHPRAWEKHHVLPVRGVRSPRRMAHLEKLLAEEDDVSRKLRHLVFEIKRSPQLFSGAQVIRISRYFGPNLIIALHLLDHHLLGVTCAEAATLIRLLPVPEQKLEALKVLSEHLLDPVNREEVTSAFPNSPVLRQQVATILSQVRGSSHVYGRIKSKSAIFLIDISGSMETEFTSECGSRFNRLEYVVHDLHKILHHRVPSDFQFNILTFASHVNHWRNSLQYAYQSTLKEAEHFLDELDPGGGTNTHDALRAALAEPSVEAIYLLSDGEPTSGITDANSIISDVRNWISMRTTPVQLHTVAFLMGHEYDDPTPRRLMGTLAAVGGGVFRCLDPHASEHEEHGDFLESSANFADDVDFQDFFANRMASIPQSALDVCNRGGLYANLPPPPNWKGGLLSRPRTAAEVSVPKIEAHKISGHHVYDVQIMLQEVLPFKPITWVLSKTFNEFKDFNNKIKDQIVALDLVHLPADPLFHTHDFKFLEQRRIALEQYLQSLYVNIGPFSNADLNEFLMYDTNVDEAIAEATDIYQANQLNMLQASAPVVVVQMPLPQPIIQ